MLQPPRLKARVENALQLERSDIKNNNYGFLNFSAEKAEIFEDVQPLHEYLHILNKTSDSFKANNMKSSGVSSTISLSEGA